MFAMSPRMAAAVAAVLALASPSSAFAPTFGITPPRAEVAAARPLGSGVGAVKLTKSKLRKAALRMGVDRVFNPASAQGGQPIDPSSTALVMIEYQMPAVCEGRG